MHANPRAAHVTPHLRELTGLRATPHRCLVGFTLGVLSLGLPWAYPVHRVMVWVGLALLVVGAAGTRWLRRRSGGALPGGLLVLLMAYAAGYGWGHWQVGRVVEARLPNCVDETTRRFELEILDVPHIEPGAVAVARFTSRVRVVAAATCPAHGRYRVRLSWYEPPALARGQRWLVEGRLRPPWGNRNRAGFDYERWLLGQALAGTGYIRSGELVAAPAIRPQPLPAIRAAIRSAIEQRDLEQGPFILALLVGDDSRISVRHWQVLRDSGTVHLLVVSGLHVGMIAGLLFQIGRGVVRLCPPLLTRMGSRRAASALALAGSGVYVWLTGAGVPAVRAWLMSGAVLILLAVGRQVSIRRILLAVLAVVVTINPLVVHQQGFWLSFAAVLSLIVFFDSRTYHDGQPGAVPLVRPLRQLITVQLVLFFALSPLLSLDQAGVPVSAPVVNAFAVPVLTFVILPLVLMTGPLLFLLPAAADALLGWTDGLLGWLIDGVALGAGVPGVAMGVTGAGEWMILAVTLMLLTAAPGLGRGLVLTALWWAVLVPDGTPPPPGVTRVTALDVGQGSAILVETRHHRLLYDAGPSYPSGFNLGDAVVVPSLRTTRRPGLDELVLSHDDLDHTGGARAVVERLAPDRIWTSFPLDDGHRADSRAQACRAGVSWQWDGVRFRFLHPPPDWQGPDNDGSCVLLVEASGGRVLIAGDISAKVERRLPKLPVDLAFAPHHGSATSSSRSYVRGYRPAVVFVSTDRRSRYGHPHPDVLARYATARVFITGRDGALTWESDRPSRVVRQRSATGAYWHAVWPDRVRTQ